MKHQHEHSQAAAAGIAVVHRVAGAAGAAGMVTRMSYTKAEAEAVVVAKRIPVAEWHPDMIRTGSAAVEAAIVVADMVAEEMRSVAEEVVVLEGIRIDSAVGTDMEVEQLKMWDRLDKARPDRLALGERICS